MLSTNSFSFLVVLLQEVTGIHVFISLFKKRGDVLSCIWRAGSKVGTNVNQKWKGWLRNSPNINTAVKILSLMELHPTQTLVWGQHGCLHGFSLLRFGFAPQVVLVSSIMEGFLLGSRCSSRWSWVSESPGVFEPSLWPREDWRRSWDTYSLCWSICCADLEQGELKPIPCVHLSATPLGSQQHWWRTCPCDNVLGLLWPWQIPLWALLSLLIHLVPPEIAQDVWTQASRNYPCVYAECCWQLRDE